ncbi:MAG: hypothetical protein IJU70_04625 [Lentisphaeria bacterium]|nr:hypothetical protein [Lentisphaeria bacterium]
MTRVRKLKRADHLFAAGLFVSVFLPYLPAVNFSADISARTALPTKGAASAEKTIAIPEKKHHRSAAQLKEQLTFLKNAAGEKKK